MNFNEMFGSAVFITPRESCTAAAFFGEFEITENAKTEIIICGLGGFRLYINDKKVSDDFLAPVTSFYHDYEDLYNAKQFGEKMSSRIYCMKYDITEYVTQGVNTITAEVGPVWYHMYTDKCVLCYKITCGENVFYSNTDCLCADSPLTEYCFSRGEKQDYTKFGFGKNNYALDERKAVQEYAMPETQYYLQDCPNDKIIKTVQCEKIFDNGEYALYDVGENITGRCLFRCPQKGAEIKVTVGEMLKDNEIDEYMSHGQDSTYICDGTDRAYGLLFTWQGFRYIRIDSAATDVSCQIIYSDIAVTSAFNSENKVLNFIYDAYIRTQLCNYHLGIPSDCPHIERRGYTGDGQLVCECAMLTLDTKKLYIKWMEDIADSQDVISGHIQYTAPYVRSGGGPGGWGCAIAEVPYAFYKIFGDEKPFAKYFPNMLHYFDYLEQHSENDLVISDQEGEWCLGDWCTPHNKHGAAPEIPEPFVNNYFYIKTIDRLVEMLDVIGRQDKKEFLLALRQKKVQAINRAFFNEETGDYADNLNSANAFALDIGLGDGRTLEALVQAVRTKKLDTGIFGTDIVPRVLFKNGYYDEAIGFLAREEYPSFGFMLANGATTLWEEWQNPRSMSHPMFGSPVKYFYYNILGIKQKGAGFDEIVIEPYTNAVTGNVSGSITTPKGIISVAVDRQSNTLTLSLPDGIKAEIVFDGKVIYR